MQIKVELINESKYKEKCKQENKVNNMRNHKVKFNTKALLITWEAI